MRGFGASGYKRWSQVQSMINRLATSSNRRPSVLRMMGHHQAPFWMTVPTLEVSQGGKYHGWPFAGHEIIMMLGGNLLEPRNPQPYVCNLTRYHWPSARYPGNSEPIHHIRSLYRH
ncbi:hypothetical protein BV25DRAFT_494689 [Artomyces pyxidatus]|uniref:Uncharacterized protein n=1 Tax=Artomyces pyxidatus TaxID=48021 RepID=A0ACB8T3B7_9AGAM|nr:hypothetical protein BV25DRAFT_494689 [Artomyces pyxidatus]